MSVRTGITATCISVLVLALATAYTPTAHAQAATAILKGKVIDENGEGVPNAIVILKSSSKLSSDKRVVSDIEGYYRIPLLSASNDYYVGVNQPGFDPISIGPLEIAVGKTVTLNITLDPSPESICYTPPPPLRRLRCGKTSVQTKAGTGLGMETVRLILEPGELVISTTSDSLYEMRHAALLIYTGLEGVVDISEKLYNVHLRLTGGRALGAENAYQSDWAIPCFGSAVIASPDSFSPNPDPCPDHFALKINVTACDNNTGRVTFEVSILP